MRLADLRLTILMVTTAIVIALTWAVFLYAMWAIGFDLGAFETFLATSAVVLAGLVVAGWLTFSRRASKTTT